MSKTTKPTHSGNKTTEEKADKQNTAELSSADKVAFYQRLSRLEVMNQSLDELQQQLDDKLPLGESTPPKDALLEELEKHLPQECLDKAFW